MCIRTYILFDSYVLYMKGRRSLHNCNSLVLDNILIKSPIWSFDMLLYALCLCPIAFRCKSTRIREYTSCSPLHFMKRASRAVYHLQKSLCQKGLSICKHFSCYITRLQFSACTCPLLVLYKHTIHETIRLNKSKLSAYRQMPTRSLEMCHEAIPHWCVYLNNICSL